MKAYQYPSKRNIVYGGRGMAATSHPLASEAGLQMLRAGGNAIDAAVAMAAALTVLEPTSNGIGGDAFAIFYKDKKIHGLNASGPAPKRIDAELVRKQGHTEMPVCGALPVNVPGAVSAWTELNRIHGKLPLQSVLAPAIRYAEEGAPVAETVSHFWKQAQASFDADDPMYGPWYETFTKDNRAPEPGERFFLPDHAKTLTAIAEDPESFYRGRLAKEIAACVQSEGGFLSFDDLAAYSPEWVTPIETAYKDHRILEIPPNGHGIVVLMALSILESLPDTSDEILYTHRMIEALKLAFSDAAAYVTDPSAMPVEKEQLLDPVYLKQRGDAITDTALTPEKGDPIRGGTVYLCAADRDGTMISFIQSNYMGFGSGLVVPRTGIALHNRGANFSLEKGHPNELKGGKRSYHTIIPGFIMKGDTPVSAFGVMGAFMQPQGQLQVLSSILRDGHNLQEALDRPRFQWVGGKRVLVERGFPESVTDALGRMGHDITYSDDTGSFGRGQIIWRNEDGVYAGATECRCDGHISAY